MERVVVDTNVLLRSLAPTHEAYVAATTALVTLTIQYREICVLPQNLIEFWNVATRPVENNGLGLTVVAAHSEIIRFESIFAVLPDSHDIYLTWRNIVRDSSVIGKQVHDARIAAAMRVHRIEKLLTFNGKDFRRFDDINVIDPHSIPADK